MTGPGMPFEDAEIRVSRRESVSVVTDARDRMANGGAPSLRADGAPLTDLILWKVNHIVETRCAICHRELAELLADWRVGNETGNSDPA